ncbi:DUF5011 domain-containing protein [uncultured Sphingobacterium sp.]|uniref:DUF5011 domain-containing protein n=1 Tax=uncultured Sphingobacterium sp. TaxID=182688 RepID=UPI0037497ECA
MKRFIYNIIPFMLVLFLFQACKKDETTDGMTHITTYPVLTMTGDVYQSVVVGGKYVEAGVTAKEGDKPLEVKVTGSVNTSKEGIYELVYSAVNSDGFPGSVSRFVAVLSTAPKGDLSGSYSYQANAAYSATMTKLAAGFYRFSNVWGASTIPVFVLSSDGINAVVPEWSLSAFGPAVGTGVLNGNILTFKITLLGQSTPPNTSRIWVKK